MDSINPYLAQNYYRGDIEQFLRNTERVCSNILEENEGDRGYVDHSYPTHTVVHHHYHPYHPYYHFSSGECRNQDEQKKSREDSAELFSKLIAGIASVIFTGFVLHTVGNNISNLWKATQEILETKKFKSRVKAYKKEDLPEGTEYFNDLCKAADLKKQIFKDTYKNSIQGLVGAAGLVGSIGVIAHGLFVNSLNQAYTGVALGTFLTVVTLVKSSYDSRNCKENAYILKNAINNLA